MKLTQCGQLLGFCTAFFNSYQAFVPVFFSFYQVFVPHFSVPIRALYCFFRALEVGGFILPYKRMDGKECENRLTILVEW